MTCWAVIPVKASLESKSRLAGALDANTRRVLVRAMLTRVVDAASQASNISQVCLLGPSRHGLPEDLPLLDEPGGGLNAAVQSALAQVSGQRVDRIVIVAADLPTVTASDLELLAAAPAGEITIAPDRHETGTNAISLPLPAAAGFSFAFGPDSFALHRAEAERLGLPVETIHSHGLARDIDEPTDLPDAAALLKQAG
ncbi:MAG: 2-phospho-L-lactate guanylyltransferase [Novosphingobium sp.]|nr:2-phospho-L-lactate guanylyltransferase [Novosphingobium sp.]